MFKLVLGAVALLIAQSVSALAIDWPKESYNPVPLSDDLVLPMPCGGAMTFRRIEVPGRDLFEDQKLVLGSAAPVDGFSEFLNQTWLSGAFTSEGTAATRHYYLGKYEVTALQRRALSGTCPGTGDQNLDAPATGLTWAEMAGFAETYSEWLVLNAAAKLPMQDDAPGFLRLPTEAEWEYAARGGARVSPSVFSANLPFPTAAMDQNVIHDGNSYRELNLAGTLAANPLGLHDMLGNAAELVLEPYRLNAVTHMHGRAGGHVVRGGSFRTRAKDIRVSAREEFPPVDSRGLRRMPHVGFRLALVAPVLASRAAIETARAAWRDLPRATDQATGAALPEEQANPVDEVLALAEAAPTEDMRKRLENLSAVIATSIRTRNQQRDRAARELLSNAVFAARQLTLNLQTVAVWERLAATVIDDGRRKRYEQNRDEDQATFQFNLSYYMDRLISIAHDYDAETLRHQAGILEVRFEQRDLKRLLPLTPAALDHLARVRERGPAAREQIAASLKVLAIAAADKE